MFDTDTELDLLRRQTSEIRKKRFSRSRLDRYRAELLLLPVDLLLVACGPPCIQRP